MSTNFPDGLTNVYDTAPLGQYLDTDPSLCHLWFDDFDSYTAGNWTVTETQAGATQAITAGDGGILALVNSAADDDLNQIQWAVSTFRQAADKRLWIKARFKVSDATQSDLLIGLYVTDTSPVASKPSSGVFFQKLDGSTSLTLQVGSASTYSSLTLGTMASDTYVTVGVYYNGADTLTGFFNDVRVGSVASTNLPTAADNSVGIALQNGDAVARTLSVDYLMIAKER